MLGGRKGRFRMIETRSRQPIECSDAGRCGRGRIKSRPVEVCSIARHTSKAIKYAPSSERRSMSTLSLVGQMAGLPPLSSTSSPSKVRARCLPLFFLAIPLVPVAAFACDDPVIEVLEGIRGVRSGATTLKICEARWVLWIGPSWRRFLRASRGGIWCAL